MYEKKVGFHVLCNLFRNWKFSFFCGVGLWHSSQGATWKKEAPRLFFPKLQNSSFPSSKICIVSHLFFVRLDLNFWRANLLHVKDVALLQDLHCFKALGSTQFHILRSLSHKLYACGTGWSEEEKLKEKKKRNRLWWGEVLRYSSFINLSKSGELRFLNSSYML